MIADFKGREIFLINKRIFVSLFYVLENKDEIKSY